ncbi:MAG: phospholipase D-like domain-containing protein [Flavobacteriales bacterium]
MHLKIFSFCDCHLINSCKQVALALVIIFFTGKNSFSQHYKLSCEPEIEFIHENGFQIHWQAEPLCEWIEWRRHDQTNYKIEGLNNKSSHQKYQFQQGEQGQIYAFRFGCVINGDSTRSRDYFFATKSLSSGRIKVFFNHPVNTGAATFSPAQFLDRAIDDTIVSFINRAESTIDIAIYNTTSSNAVANFAEALNNAHNRGVRVRIVYDAEASNLMINNLNSAIGRIPSRVGFNYGLMHNKFMVIDVESPDPGKPLVWTGSTNWTVAQLNGPDENNAILVQDQALARAFTIEFEEMFGSTGAQPNSANARFGPDKTDNTPKSFIVGGRLIRLYFSPTDGTNQQLINTINSANSDIFFASMIITRNDLASAIINKVNQGISRTYGITDDSLASPPAPAVWALLRQGLPAGQMISKNGFEGTMHHKFLFVDHFAPQSDPQVLTGSHNWSNNAENRNDENTLIVHDHDVVNHFYQAFLWMFNTISGGSLHVSEVFKNDHSIRLYPNPVFNHLFFEFDHHQVQNLEIGVYDLGGRKVEHIKVHLLDSKGYIDVNQLHSGAYVLKMNTGKQIFTARFLKE